MLIALDYDGTYTADPEFWECFIQMCRLRGIEIICVTMRYEHEPVKCGCMPYYTGRKAKRQWCEYHGIKPDIWIDDRPEWIFQDTT